MSGESLYFHHLVRTGLGGLGIVSSAEPTLSLEAALVSGGAAPEWIPVDSQTRSFRVVGPADVVKLSPAAVRTRRRVVGEPDDAHAGRVDEAPGVGVGERRVGLGGTVLGEQRHSWYAVLPRFCPRSAIRNAMLC
jgi:hypothetical protein